MAWEVYLGNDVDVALGGVPDDAAHFFLGVVALLWGVVGDAAVLADDGVGAVLALECELGHALYFEAPALVVGEVPVELVEAVEGENVDIGVDEIDWEVVA